MTNLTAIPLQDDFETTLAQLWDGTDNTIYVNDVPEADAPTGSEYTYIVISPWQSNMQVRKVTSWESVGNTFTATTTVIEKGDGVDYTDQSHAATSVVRFSNNYQFWKDIQTAINSKLDQNGGNTTTTFDLDLVGSAWRIRSDSGVMKFTDDANPEVSLSTLASGGGADTKVSVSVTDTTPAVLNSKVTVTAPIQKSILNPAGDETLNLNHDFTNTTYYVATSAGAADSGKVPKLNGSGVLDTTFLPTYPTYKRDVVILSRDMTTASGAVAYNHWLGVAPQLIQITGYYGNIWFSTGAWDGTDQAVSYLTSSLSLQGNETGYIVEGLNTGANQKGAISAVGTTTFTITRTKSGAPEGMLYATAVLTTIS